MAVFSLSCFSKSSSLKPYFARNTRFSDNKRPFEFKLNTNERNTLAKSFVPMISRDWNFSVSVFPTTYILQLFNIRLEGYLDSDPTPEMTFSSFND